MKTLILLRGYGLFKYFKIVLNNWLIQFQIITSGFHSLHSRQPLLSSPFVSGYSGIFLPYSSLSLCSHSPTGNWVIYTNYLFSSSTDPRNEYERIANFLTRKMYGIDSRMRINEPVVRHVLRYTLFFLWGRRLSMHRIMENKTKYNTTHWQFI